jgi:hypothetical protein
MKTAVEQIIDEFNEELKVAVAIGNKDKIRIIKHLITIATLHLPKEKEQIKDAHVAGHNAPSSTIKNLDAEQYYTETFKPEP